MADLIAREDYALSIGGGGCSSYAANRGVTKARAISMGASVSGSYSDNLLVPLKDLYKASTCTCNTLCVGYGCACNQECKGYALACNSECGGYWCTCNGDTCPTYCGSKAACSCNSQCSCESQGMCTSHCFSEVTCSCDGVCDPYLSGSCSSDNGRAGCTVTSGNCDSICLCTSIRQAMYEGCYSTCWCYGGHCHYYGEKSSGCLPNCSDCGSNCNNCICNNDTCSSHCDGYGGAGCDCWNNNRYTCTCWNEARYSCTCWSLAVYS